MKPAKQIELDHVSYRAHRQGSLLVRDINMVVEQGKIISIIGPNGAGKSTTLKLLVGLLRPSSGRRIVHQPTKIAYVPQAVTVPHHTPMTAQDLISMGGGVNARNINACLEAVDLPRKILSRPLQHASGGEKQRLLLARALIKNPQMLVMDEPLQGIDQQSIVTLYRLIAQSRDRLQCSVVMISHDVHLVLAATDTVYCLNGHVCCSGSPESMHAHPEYVQLFGEQAQALALYRHQPHDCHHQQ